MACVALTSLISTIELEFLEPTSRVRESLRDRAPIKPLVATLSSWKFIFQLESSDALRDLEFQIREFALKAEDDIEIHLSNFVLAKDTEHEEEASQELYQTLQEAAEIAAQFSDKEEVRERGREVTCNALTSLISTIQHLFLQRTHFWRVSRYDQPRLVSFLGNLSSFQAFLQKKKKPSGDDGGALRLRDLEIQIRDFALETQDAIVYREDAPHQLRQTWLEAAKNATDLLKILTGENESHLSDGEMASAALTILIAKFKYYFLQIFPSVYDRDKATMIYFLANLNSLQVCLMQMKSNGAAAIKIRNFALKAVNDIEIQLSNFRLGKHAGRVTKASQILHQTLQEAAEIAANLLKIIHKEEQHERKRVMTCGIKSTLLEHSSQQVFLRLNTFMTKLYYDFLHSTPIVPLEDEAAIISFFQNLSSLQDYLLQKESSGGGGGATINDLETEIRYFVIKVGDDVETQVKNLVQAKHDAEYQEQASQLNQTLQEAAETVAELLMSINSEKECKTDIEIACIALSSLMGTIEEFLYAEVATKSFRKSPHDKAGIKSNLLGKLFSLQVFLQKESNGGSATMKYLETKIKNFTLKAKDDIKIQLYNFLEAKDTEYEEKVSQELHHTMQGAAESAAELLKIINSRSNEVDDANETQPSNTWLKHASRSANVESDGSWHGLLMPWCRMVGRHHDCRVIKDQLFSAEELKVISIVGMVGIGKTTVAKNVYEDPSVASRFDVRGWVTIPQDYDKSRMLSDLLLSITPAEQNVIIKRGTPDELEMQVRECLRRWRYLIVLDNLLSNQAWTDIIQCLPDYCRGSCILLTTSYLNRYDYQNKYIHNLTLLDPKESWELFGNILSIEEHLAPKFEKIRNHVVEKCDGLPQLIVEVAKRLSKCNNIQQGWKKIEKQLESLGLLDRNALSFSYNMLPHHLKVCFLYFGVFPKRKKLLVKMLIRLWIAEGFVKPLKHKELEDQAYEYLKELTDRSLLLIEDRSCNGKIKTCRMHSGLHSFCVGEAQKGGILCAVNTQQHSGLSLKSFTNSCRWLSSYSHSFDYYVLFGTNIPRSIFFFLENPEMFVPLKLLRVLAFDTSISLQRVPIQLGDLVFLRYLSITQWFDELDDVVSNNPNLETLVVSGNGAPTIHLPSSIWKPPHMKHLALGNSYMVDPPSADKTNLQTLSWVVRALHCRKQVYSKFPDIKNLKILLKDDIEPSHIGGSCSNPIILDHFDYLKAVKKLSILVSIGCNAALPEQCMYPSRLEKLKLSGTNISDRDLNVIAMLPRLKVLKLENAFHGTVWEVAEGGFRKLIFLLLEAKELKQWVANFREHFKELRHLVLRSCYCLEQMPKDCTGYKLESIELEGCHSSLVASAMQLQQKRRSKDLEIKILDLKYDESQNTHTEVSM